MFFEIVGKLVSVEVIAKGKGIRELNRLKKFYGPGLWRKMKGEADIKLASGIRLKAEIHWYEAHGIGKKELKIKRILEL